MKKLSLDGHELLGHTEGLALDDVLNLLDKKTIIENEKKRVVLFLVLKKYPWYQAKLGHAIQIIRLVRHK